MYNYWIYYSFAARDSISRAYVQLCISFFLVSDCFLLCFWDSHIIIIHCFDIFCMIMVLTLRGTSSWTAFHLYISNFVHLRIIIWKFVQYIILVHEFIWGDMKTQKVCFPSLNEIPTENYYLVFLYVLKWFSFLSTENN